MILLVMSVFLVLDVTHALKETLGVWAEPPQKLFPQYDMRPPCRIHHLRHSHVRRDAKETIRIFVVQVGAQLLVMP